MKKNDYSGLRFGYLIVKFVLIMKLIFSIIVFSSLQVIAFDGASQKRIDLNLKGTTIAAALDQIENNYEYRFFYNRALDLDRTVVDVYTKNASIDHVMQKLLESTSLSFKKINKGLMVIIGKMGENTLFPVKGEVVNQEGLPLAGVSVVEKGTDNGTTTDESGMFSLEVANEDAILVVTYIGHQSREISIKKNDFKRIVLESLENDLDNVVVVGYGTVKKSDLTGAVAQVKEKDINAFPNANVIQALSGRASGVIVNQTSGAPGPGLNIRIRGGNSILGSNEPLYVIDGFPLSGNSANPSHINTSDIESVEILKDASSTAIYGSRGANGVVMITTKKGKTGRTRVDFDFSRSTQRLIKKLDLMNATEYARFYNEQAANDDVDPYFSEEEISAMGEGFDWQDFVFQKAPMTTASLNMNGGNASTQFSLGASYFGQEGIIKGSDYTRYSLQTSLNHRISDRFRVQFSGLMTRLSTRRKDSQGGSRGNSMISAAVSAPPSLTPYNDDGSYRVLHTNPGYQFLATDIRNPINFINEQSNQVIANVVLLNTAVLYNIIPDLVLKVSGGIENRDDRADNYRTTKFFNSQGVASVSTSQQTSLLNENTLHYNKTFAEKHTIDALAGFTYQDFTTKSLGAGGIGFLSDVFETYNLSGAATPDVPESGYSKSVLLSYLGRVNYTYNDKYLLTASIRRDGSSKYSDGMKWGYFPSAALAWRVSKENFFTENRIFSELKLRTSWGITGSQAIDPYRTLNTLQDGRTIFSDNYATTFSPGTRLPGELKWETTEQIDFGLDIGILKNRLFITTDFYVKNTSNLLSTVLLPSSMGYTNTTQNVGEIQNRGVEIALDGKVLTGKFEWNLNGNIAFNRNKVIRLYDGEDILRDNISVVVVNDATSILREGQPVGRFWGYQEEGYDEDGDIIFSDLNGDGSISPADKTYIGDPNPNFIYGLNSVMNFKNFEFNVFFQGMQGNDIFNASAITNTMDMGFGLNMTRDVYNNHWTPTNTNAKYPRISRSTPVRVSDRFIEDGSYLRLKNIMLAYNFPVETMSKKWIRNLQLYVSGQNLWTLTNYSWWDPETNFRLDHSSYPLAKSVSIGLRVGF